MIEITEAAVSWIVEHRRGKGVPASFGIRIAEVPESGRIGVRSVAEQRTNERTIERQGIRFFVSEDLAGKLAGRVIDVGTGPGDGLLLRRKVHESGNGRTLPSGKRVTR